MGQSDEQIRIQLFDAMMDCAFDAIVFVDPENRIRYWNRAAEELFGVSCDEFADHDRVRDCLVMHRGEPEHRQSLLRRGRREITIDRDGTQVTVARTVDVLEIGSESWFMIRLLEGHLSDQSELHRLAHTDHLSGLLNRRGFQAALEENLNQRLSLAIIDVDFFKNINDTEGHDTGDAAIRWIADKLSNSFPDAICIGRLGGDEFGVVQVVSDRDKTENQFATFCQSVSNDAKSLVGNGFTISIGVAIAGSSGVTVRELLTQADRAMYQSKNAGRNRSLAVDV